MDNLTIQRGRSETMGPPQWRTLRPVHGADHDGNLVPVAPILVEWPTSPPQYDVALLIGVCGIPVVLSPRQAELLQRHLAATAPGDVPGQQLSDGSTVTVALTISRIDGHFRLETSAGEQVVLRPATLRALGQVLQQVIE